MFLDEASRMQNFRQVGTKATGQLKKGAGMSRQHADASRTTSSIPSKFETILNLGERETNAFGSRTNRFGEPENELPGPGAYYKPPSMVVTHAKSGSVSKKGMGTGFVSKVKRFNDSNHDPVPGPGQYTATMLEKSNFNRRIGLSSFARVERMANQSAGSAPGPGEYNQAVDGFDARVEKGSRSVFASRTNRGFVPRAEGPAPGQYENVLALEQEIRRGQSHAQSIFKSTVRRVETPKQSVPGPGAYRVEAAEHCLRHDTTAQAQASSMFKKGAADRFGRALERKTDVFEVPGPGAYASDRDEATTSSTVASSVFKSNVKRSQGERATKAPGPAFYKPSSPGKKSHLLNGTKKWL
ncbi:hypothetical protein H310_05475 [Aphanomyces invadans]|uniref:Uncharacterized protein n=1 Tax=Aphanomyces invadans TaxID=157072 RepID=A0A024UA04_9STRA|nr:hypothetical protein H310_05475 [Aphanomyces invadans]ETW03045.1 hypothetical protein H310_05475 [Aphanomyces invadans]|eukprot:XP_008868429.1 hypothetical protein H310_05475 [Aphanomyces invadans]